MPRYAKTSARAIAKKERAIKVLELRRSGLNFEQIAERVGVSPATCYRDVHEYVEALGRHCTEGAQQVLALELQRLDELSHALYHQAKGGDVQAIDRYLKTMERRAKYLGLDAPEVHDLRGSVGVRAERPDLSKLSTEELETFDALYRKALSQ